MTSIVVKGSREEGLVKAEPHRWALSRWARAYRRLARPIVVSRHVRKFCTPFDLQGAEHFSELRGPAVIIANHTSHFDTLIVLSVLPDKLYDQTAVVAAADRFYTEKLKGAWYSLRYNAFPIARHGGSAALDYSEWLLRNDWSLLIFPEGTRSKTGDLLPFHPGPAILAKRQGLPVLPVHIQGADSILKPGTRWSQPAPVKVQVGQPLVFTEEDSVSEAVAKMEAAMRELAQPQQAHATAL